MPTDDQTLLHRMQQGDESAFGEIFSHYHQRLLMEAFFILQDEQQAKDIVQEIFIEFWKKQHWKNIHSLSAYLGTAVRNRCLNHLQSAKTAEKRQEAYKYLASVRETADESSYNSIAIHPDDKIDQMHVAIDNLPQKTAEIFRLYYLEKKKRSVIAGELGISVNTVKTVLLRGLKVLRSKLK
jgi:RNA polymerase sigma-70 factor (ECF subfamily)